MLLIPLEHENKKLLLELGGGLAMCLSWSIHAKRNPEMTVADILEKEVTLPIVDFLSPGDFGFDNWDAYFDDYNFEFLRKIDARLVQEELIRVASTAEGKQAIVEYVMAHDLELSLVSDINIIFMAIFSSDLFFKIFVRLIKAVVNAWSQNSTNRNTSEEKSILFFLLMFKNSSKNIDAIKVYDCCIERFQKKSGLDYEYIEEFESLAKKFLQVRNDVMDLILE